MLSTIITSAIIALAPMSGGQAVDVPQTPPQLPACQYEDGNPDGQPCWWTSPRTGLVYFNDGANYR